MKLKYQLFFLIAVINFNCKNQDVNTETSIPVTKNERKIVYGDDVIEATLINIQVEGNVLKGKLEFQNKRRNKVSFHLKDFIFKCGDNKGVLPNKNIAQKKISKEIPNFENMTNEEQSKARFKSLRQKIKSIYLFNLVVKLEPYKKMTKEIEIDFQNEIEIEKLKFYFNGQYKSLLNL